MNMEETVAFSIEAGYEDLRASEKKAADYILKHLRQVREMPLEELAAECEVSQPTILRMLKSLGYTGFRDFKYAVVEELAKERDEHGLAPRGYSLAPTDELKDVPAKMAAAAAAMIEGGLKSLSLKTYQQVIEVLESAGRVELYGIENSGAVCGDLETKLSCLGLNCKYHRDPYLQRISAASLTEKDAVIGISCSGAAADTIDAVKTAKEQGAAVVVITNDKTSGIVRYADFLLCTAQEPFFYGCAVCSAIPQILIGDMLCMGLLTANYEKYGSALEKSSSLIRGKVYEEDQNV